MEKKSLPLCDLFSFETRHFDAGILEVFQGEITKYRKKRNAKNQKGRSPSSSVSSAKSEPETGDEYPW